MEFGPSVDTYDLIVVGGGAAGVVAAVTGAREGLRVALLAKDGCGYGNTRISGGAIATDDHPEELVRDVLRSGDGLCSEELVATVAADSQRAVALLEEAGHVWKRHGDGSRDIRHHGGHAKPRGLKSPNDGVSLGQALRGAAARWGLDVFEEAMVFELLEGPDGIGGVLAFELIDGRIRALLGPSVVLATGGAGWLFYPHTNNIKGVAGDGYALALRSGCELIDMEFLQFLPFALTYPPSSQGLDIGEPSDCAGPHGVLLDARRRLLLDRVWTYNRAQLSRTIWQAIGEGGTAGAAGVLLDVSGNLRLAPGEVWNRPIRFGNVLFAYGGKAYRGEAPVEVAPTLHYVMGGIRADAGGRTPVDGLYAVGEARGGVHGANRLATMAILEAVSSGYRASTDAVGRRGRRGAGLPEARERLERAAARIHGVLARPSGARASTYKAEMRACLWAALGGLRAEDAMRTALARLAGLRESFGDCRVEDVQRYNLDLVDYLEASLMFDTADAVLQSALLRRDSRGAHMRAEPAPAPGGRGAARTVVAMEGATVRARLEEAV